MNTESILHITMLGEFTISYRGKSIRDQSNRSKKPWNLLEYLIAFRAKEISQNELIELLWEDESSENPAGALKVLLHRVRKILEELEYDGEESLIVQRRGTYAWNQNVKYAIDTDLFEDYCKKAMSDTLSEEERISLMLDALDCYKGDFLPKNSCETWVIPISVYYHSLYVKTVNEVCVLLKNANRYSDIEHVCLRALSIEQLDEKIYLQLINALACSGKQQEAIKQYNNVNDLFFTKFGITPSDELKSLYREIVKTSQNFELDLDTIKGQLKEKEIASGAFFCEYEFFKDIYQIESRACARSGDSIYLCLMTLTYCHALQPDQKSLSKAMDDLKQCVQTTLRKGDVFARYSLTQYIIMLPTISYENGEMVLERILNSFYKRYTRKNIDVQFKLKPLDPVM